MRALVDESVFREQEVSIGSGEAGAGIILSVVDLIQALPAAEKASLLDFA